jgi:co-chaperonin GroES (HSP10)
MIVNADQAVLPAIRPLGHWCLIEVLEEVEEATEKFGIVLPDQERSQQGIVLAVGGLVDASPDGIRPGDRVIFDDTDCPYWRGATPMSYLSVVLGEGTEYVLVPEEQILSVVEGDHGGDEPDGENAPGGDAGDGPHTRQKAA